MDATTNLIVAGMAGTHVDLVVYEDGLTKLVKAEVAQSQPLVLTVDALKGAGIRAARRVMIVAHVNGVSMRAEGHLDLVKWSEGKGWLEVGNVHWEVLDRRRHKRVDVDVPVTMKLVLEEGNQAKIVTTGGRAADMSISGAQVKMEVLPHEGTLVHFDANLDGKLFRALALVAHIAQDGGTGIHFVEYFGAARHDLQDFLRKKAA